MPTGNITTFAGAKDFSLTFAVNFSLALLLSFLLPVTFPTMAVAQKNIDESEETWLAYFNQTRLTDRSGIWLDSHLRLADRYVGEKTFFIIRPAYVYHFNQRLRLMAGYAYANRYNREIDRVPEHRPWQQLQLTDRRRGFSLVHGLRSEERFRRNVRDGMLSAGYKFNWRFRYSIALTVPLGDREVVPDKPFLLFSNEIMVNAGNSITGNHFDQNRTFGGLGYQFTSGISAHLGHLFIFQHQGLPGSYLHIHAVRFYVIHNLDLRSY